MCFNHSATRRGNPQDGIRTRIPLSYWIGLCTCHLPITHT
ncbi:hypothetical protein [Enterococcus phage PEF1]